MVAKGSRSHVGNCLFEGPKGGHDFDQTKDRVRWRSGVCLALRHLGLSRSLADISRQPAGRRISTGEKRASGVHLLAALHPVAQIEVGEPVGAGLDHMVQDDERAGTVAGSPGVEEAVDQRESIGELVD